MAERRYQLQNEAANALIAQLLEAAAIPQDRRGYFQHMLTTVLKLHEDGAPSGDLKITNTALKELRYAYKVFAPYRGVRKVTVFGSARTPATEAAARAALAFGRRMVEEGWMVVTGAGAGIMGAAQEGAGGRRRTGWHGGSWLDGTPRRDAAGRYSMSARRRRQLGAALRRRGSRPSPLR